MNMTKDGSQKKSAIRFCELVTKGRRNRITSYVNNCTGKKDYTRGKFSFR